MEYEYYKLPPLAKLSAASEANEPAIERLRQLTRYIATFQATRDWPRLRRSHAVYEQNEIVQAAKDACARLLQEKRAITNDPVSFSMLCIQSYIGAYERIIEMAEQNPEDMRTLVRLVRHRTEADAITFLAEREKSNL